MAKDNRSPIVTKKHLARVERERIQRRNILIVSAIVIALVVILTGWGIVKTYIIEPRQPVVTVDGTEVSTSRFQAMVNYNASQLVEQYYQYYQFMQMFGGDTSSQSSFVQTLSQISYQLEPEYLGQTTIDSLVEEVLVRKEAKSRGITVSKEDIDETVKGFMGYYPEGTPTTAPTEEIKPTSTLSALQMTLVPPTSTPTTTPTASLAADSTEAPLTATPTTAAESEPTEKPSEPSATSTVAPTPTEYTAKLYNDNLKSYLDYIGISENELHDIIEYQLIRGKVIEAITADIATETDQVWARKIVVADEETAKQVAERLNAGEAFADLAAELSIDEATKSLGGDLGWAGTDYYDETLEPVIFGLDVGQISEPIQATDGWYIIQLLGHEVRPISDSQYQELVSLAYNNWLTEIKATAQIDTMENWIDRMPNYPEIPANMQLSDY